MTNREIKFRAWDINNKMMVRFGLYSLLVDGTEADKYWKTHYERGMIDLEVMQYTGLKDKSGREVYEGDIYECATYCSGRQFSGEPGVKRFTVVFVTDGFTAKRHDYKSYYQFSLLDEPLYLGNIYEHPYLLDHGSQV